MIISFEITDPLDLAKKAYFKMLGREDTYNVSIVINDGIALFKPSDCDCMWGSFGSQTKANREKNKHCRHIEECLQFLKREAWIKDE